MNKLPRTFQYCIRCDKDCTHDPIHTCTPSAKYRAGMEEGRKELQAKYDKAIAFIEMLSNDRTKYPLVTDTELAREFLTELNKPA